MVAMKRVSTFVVSTFIEISPKRNSSLIRFYDWIQRKYYDFLEHTPVQCTPSLCNLWKVERRMRISAFSSTTLLSISHRAPTAEHIINIIIACGKVNHRHTNSIESDLFVQNLLKYFMVDLCV